MRIKHSFAARVVTDPVDALRRLVYGRGALEACAEAIGIAHQTLSKKLSEEDGNCPSLRQAAAIDQFMDTDALAECFAARRGGIFIKLPAVSGELEELVQAWSRLLKEQADAAGAFSDAIADRKITAAEVDRFEAELRDVTVAGQQLVRAARARVGACGTS